MIKISTSAKKVMDRLTLGLEAPGAHKKIDNSPGFMAVHIENVGSCELGPMFSIAHYYEQNSDLMKDPDMVLNDLAQEELTELIAEPFVVLVKNISFHRPAIRS